MITLNELLQEQMRKKTGFLGINVTLALNKLNTRNTEDIMVRRIEETIIHCA